METSPNPLHPPVDILVAEDSPTQAKRLEYILQQQGYGVRLTSNGRLALAAARQRKPTLIISDVVMPEMDGFELCLSIKSDAALADVPVFLVTTLSDPLDVIRGLEYRADNFIVKPYSEHYLLNRIQFALLNSQMGKSESSGIGVEIYFNGRKHFIESGRLQILNLLLSTYDAAIQRNKELGDAQQEMRAINNALASKEEEIRAIVDNLFDAVMTTDAQGSLRSANPALTRLLGYAAEEILGQDIERVVPGIRGAVERNGPTPTGAEVEVRHKDGRLVPCELTVGAYRVHGGQFHVYTLRDVSERRRYVGELTKAWADARQANQTKSDFLAAMSHEIRTPMNGVVGMIDVLARSSLNPHQTAMVDTIRESAFALLSIIEDILDFSKIEAGRMEIERVPLVVADVVEKVCTMLNRLAEKQNVELTLFTDPAIPDDLVGDALRLRQVLINLINNAIKFSGGAQRIGKVAARALVVDMDETHATLEFQVTDNGIGMDQDTLSKLFSAFAQGDSSTTRRFGGTGLGLAISHNLTTLMGGVILVKSAPGEGSTFTLRLPFARESGAASGRKPALRLDGLNCLIIGSGDALPADLAAYLIDAGAHTATATDLSEACTLVATQAQGLWVWVVNAGSNTPPALEELRRAARTNEKLDTRFVVIGRGASRYPHHTDADRVLVDDNVLTRGALVRAVSVAAGWTQEEDEVHEVPRATVPIAQSREQARKHGRLILVAEDNAINQIVIMQQLTLLGFTADVAGDGVQALMRWRSGDYALLLTDLHMPGMDGYQLTAAIRAEEQGAKRTPIVALTANALKSEDERCLAAGMNDYMSKPTPLTDLQAMLDKWLPEPGASSANTPSGSSKALTGSVVDVNVLRQLVGNDQQVIADLLRDLRASTASIARDIARAYAAGDVAAMADAAHKLKSSVRSVGAMALGELCERMEAAGRTGESSALQLLHAQFSQEVVQLDHGLTQALAELKTAGSG